MHADTGAPMELAAIDRAQAAFDAGRFEEVLLCLRPLVADAPADSDDGRAARLCGMAAFRLGELDEALAHARRAIERVGISSAAPACFDMLAVTVVAAGELVRFDEAVEALRQLQSMAARSGVLVDHVRGRGSTAVLFSLLGDPWAGQRLLAETIGLFQGLPDQRRLEATARNNHTAVSLQLARMALQGGDTAAAETAVDHAQASLDRVREIAAELGDPRMRAFADVHEGEIAMLSANPTRAGDLLGDAARAAEQSGLWAHVRQLNLLLAEARLAVADAQGAREHLQKVGERLGAAHDIGVRIRYHSALHRVWIGLQDNAQAVAHLERARELAQHRQYRQLRAQSSYLRTRLELEHLYPYRGRKA
jgi:tetratricopeptide (TPR) repeat protein